MKPDTARTVADALTWSRIFCVVPITVFAVLGLKWWVCGLYMAAAITDGLDGWFARRGAPPRNDVDLDGIADLVLSFSTVLWLWLLVPGFIEKYWLPYLPIVLALELYLTPGRIRHKRYGIPHLQFGRYATALFFLLLPAVIVLGDVTWLVHGVLIVAVASKLQLAWVFWTRDTA